MKNTATKRILVMSILVQYFSHRFFILTRRRYFALPRIVLERLKATSRPYESCRNNANPGVVKVLLDAGADMNTQDNIRKKCG